MEKLVVSMDKIKNYDELVERQVLHYVINNK